MNGAVCTKFANIELDQGVSAKTARPSQEMAANTTARRVKKSCSGDTAAMRFSTLI
jgi:hypothetical protein